jgi:hypothetical protein
LALLWHVQALAGIWVVDHEELAAGHEAPVVGQEELSSIGIALNDIWTAEHEERDSLLVLCGSFVSYCMSLRAARMEVSGSSEEMHWKSQHESSKTDTN